MAVHFTLYPEQPIADALHRFMAAHNCSATRAVELLLARDVDEAPASDTRPSEEVPALPSRAA